jgi:hypothetical protein
MSNFATYLNPAFRNTAKVKDKVRKVFQPASPFDAATVWTCLPCWDDDDDDDDDEITYFSFILDGWKIRCLGYWYYIYIYTTQPCHILACSCRNKAKCLLA